MPTRRVDTLLASHLDARKGGAWLAAAPAPGPHLRLWDRALRWRVPLTVASTRSNGAETAVKAYLHVRGVEATGEPVNDAVLALLGATVVLPTRVAAGLWVRGLFPHR